MTERKRKLMDIREVLIHLQAQSSDHQIQKDTRLMDYNAQMPAPGFWGTIRMGV
jgi:hypothetical protein